MTGCALTTEGGGGGGGGGGEREREHGSDMAAMTETCIVVRGTACKITCVTQERERKTVPLDLWLWYSRLKRFGTETVHLQYDTISIRATATS